MQMPITTTNTTQMGGMREHTGKQPFKTKKRNEKNKKSNLNIHRHIALLIHAGLLLQSIAICKCELIHSFLDVDF